MFIYLNWSVVVLIFKLNVILYILIYISFNIPYAPKHVIYND